MIVDPESIREHRRTLRLCRGEPAPAAEPQRTTPQPRHCRVFLSIHRGDGWPVARIAECFRMTPNEVQAQIDLALRAERED